MNKQEVCDGLLACIESSQHIEDGEARQEELWKKIQAVIQRWESANDDGGKYQLTTITPMTADDVEATVAALQEYAVEMGYPFDGEHVMRILSPLSLDGNWVFMVAKDEDGRIAGVSVMVVVPSLYDSAMDLTPFEARSAPRAGPNSGSIIRSRPNFM